MAYFLYGMLFWRNIFLVDTSEGVQTIRRSDQWILAYNEGDVLNDGGMRNKYKAQGVAHDMSMSCVSWMPAEEFAKLVGVDLFRFMESFQKTAVGDHLVVPANALDSLQPLSSKLNGSRPPPLWMCQGEMLGNIDHFLQIYPSDTFSGGGFSGSKRSTGRILIFLQGTRKSCSLLVKSLKREKEREKREREIERDHGFCIKEFGFDLHT
eukprot:1146815-Pelagomonas_calceolata.AAC.1